MTCDAIFHPRGFPWTFKFDERSDADTRVKHRGITEDAAKLGVHRIHLWLVQSRSLLKRYLRLKKGGMK